MTRNGIAIDRVAWSVFLWNDPNDPDDPQVVSINILGQTFDPITPPPDMSLWKFRLLTNPGSTGIYVLTGGRACGGSKGADRTSWERGPTINVQLIRCGLGDSPPQTPYGFHVEAMHDKDKRKQEFVIARIDTILQGWHQDDRTVNYGFNFSIKNSRPAGVHESNYNEVVLEISAAIAAQILNGDLNLSRDVFESTDGSGNDVTVRAFWEDATTTCTALTALGCFTQQGNYPHLSHGDLMIRYPPNPTLTSKGAPTEWTDNEVRATSYKEDPDRYFFLPAIIAHEFGHALGVYHLPSRHLMGGYSQGNAWNNTPDTERHRRLPGNPTRPRTLIGEGDRECGTSRPPWH